MHTSESHNPAPLRGPAPGARRFWAPGRINLIGEHTDYNQGLVMPAAIQFGASVALRPGDPRRIELRSLHYPDAVAFPLDGPPAPPRGHWSDALRGIALLLERAGHCLAGARVTIESEVPIGAGLSSSAAVEMALALALATVNGLQLEPHPDLHRTALALLCQRSSHEFGGTRCGLMDPYIAAHGRAGQIVLLDTRTLEAHWMPWPPALALVVCDTGVRHHNATSQYNLRRQECERAVSTIARTRPGLASLRDLTLPELERAAAHLTPTLVARARHVVSENARVAQAREALEASDFPRLGALLAASHRSLRDDYEVSCAELDLMAELCGREPSLYGARMMGGGFGGCVLALAASTDLDGVRRRLAAAYLGATGITPSIWLCQPSAGAAELAPAEALAD